MGNRNLAPLSIGRIGVPVEPDKRLEIEILHLEQPLPDE
jgi:hypothetical protein